MRGEVRSVGRPRVAVRKPKRSGSWYRDRKVEAGGPSRSAHDLVLHRLGQRDRDARKRAK